jgi:ribosomal protein L20
LNKLDSELGYFESQCE